MNLGTERDWEAARKELLAAELDLEKHVERVEQQRRELPWVPVENEYTLATDAGSRTLPELFEGRSRLLIYHLMFGEEWEVACPGCTSVADGLGGAGAHPKDPDGTLICMLPAPPQEPSPVQAPRRGARPSGAAH